MVTKIPLVLHIGITGHRILPDEQRIRENVKKVMVKVEALLPKTPHTFYIISPLAEGADRVATEEILKLSSLEDNTFLEAILPLSPNEYHQDFAGDESKTQFNNLLNLANVVNEIDQSESREDAYYKAGTYTVDNCDVLIAIWDGKPPAGLGGTAQIIEYAKKNGKRIFWINSNDGSIKEINSDKTLEYLDIYNKENINLHIMEKTLERLRESLKENAKKAKLPSSFLNPIQDTILPQFVRADLLAQKYQKLYSVVGSLIYILAAGAVATVTIQLLFFPKLPQLIWFEVAEISIILILLLVSSQKHWHRKWIDYRFLAERIRTAIFFRVANIRCEITTPPPHLKITAENQDWMVRAFMSLWDEKQHKKEIIPFQPFKNFLLDAWLDDQINYYQSSAHKNRLKHKIFSRVGELFFVLTLVVASMHALNIEPFHNPGILPATAIILPAIAAALTGIRNNHEYSRNAKRYQQMAHHTLQIRENIEKVGNMESLVELLDNANKIMLGEHQDWRVVVLLHKLEPP
ncbi:MAG: SLATT domain-containing protein [Methanobacterium sp.]|uniref:SLATT domain-containing protein n=1 Tax=Methanobacterium sp. TaxID=2164 RepID=UPI003D64E86A|nr:SLATT domain-containing protein [Methanobacterium sp.]